MKTVGVKQMLIIVVLGLLGWALCGATMFVGMAVTDMQTALIIHAVAAPIFFGSISWFYFNRFRFTSPPMTASIFLFIVMFMDFFLVALVINRSFEMFTSLLGTWIPFLLIFLSTYVVGIILSRRGAIVETA